MTAASAPPLAGRTALVTGAARGIGRAISERLAEEGADVVVVDRDAAAGEACAAAVRARGRRAWTEGADVAAPESVAALFARCDAAGIAIDILVNNAGVTQAADIFAIEPADWHRIVDTNLGSCYLCARAALERMRGRGQGRIVSISSVSGQQGALYGHVHYSASKAGIIGFTKALARTAAPLGVTVNAVAPGIIATDLLRTTHGEDGVAALAKSVPLGLGEPDDVGRAVAFLCGPGGRYITGATLDVNGGMYLR